MPAQVVSERVDALAEPIERKLSVKDTVSAGLKAQYEHQLQMLKNPTVPDVEFVIFPVNMHPAGEITSVADGVAFFDDVMYVRTSQASGGGVSGTRTPLLSWNNCECDLSP